MGGPPKASEPDDPLNFEAVLYPNGNIKLNYLATQAAWWPTIGVSAGDGVHYTISSRDGANRIPANASSLMTHPAPGRPGALSGSGVLSGTPIGSAAGYNLSFTVVDSASSAHSVAEDPPPRTS